MKTQLNVLSLSAGKIEDNGMLYANLVVLDGKQSNQIDPDRIDVGQKHAKIKLSTDDNNSLARRLANSGLIPCILTVDLDTTVKKNEVAMIVTDFEALPASPKRVA